MHVVVLWVVTLWRNRPAWLVSDVLKMMETDSINEEIKSGSNAGMESLVFQFSIHNYKD
jgi:hypothetical protein